jgi:hypothetical protein
MLCIRKEEVCSRSGYGAATQRCGELDLDGICGDVRRKDPKAPPPLVCRYCCLVMCLAMARLPLDRAQKHFAALNGLFTGRCIAARMNRLHPTRCQKSDLS